jgi:hypothetical protein
MTGTAADLYTKPHTNYTLCQSSEVHFASASSYLEPSQPLLEYALSLARGLAYIWPRCPHQYYLCATPPSGYDPYAFNPRTSYPIT